ncbi:ATP-binding protein [Streptomyces sp. GC420]|uniref:ATP-binding protein n=1 Tax=Streptomyces sp. GC420 TaxID=2697568 RepID=UPI0014151FA0|nr:ATP-binding protein [Streptomyces sp. GC420]NBM16728.1 ATP-binding protein [Streptomyces sp. GC420]
MFTKWSCAFPGLPEQVAEARHFVAALLHGWSGADDAVLVVGELAANAVKHTQSGEIGGWFLVSVGFRDDRLRVQVKDQGGDRVPQMCDVTSHEEGGRGLMMVAACSKDWGAVTTPDGSRVWADFAWESA